MSGPSAEPPRIRPDAPIAVNLERSKNSGDILAGNNNMKIDNRGGTLIVHEPWAIAPERRDPPLHLTPTPAGQAVGRDELAEELGRAIGSDELEIFGEPGFGKTTVLEVTLDRLAGWDERPVVYVDAGELETDGVLARVFHGVFETTVASSPPPEQLPAHLQPVDMLVVLDHLDESKVRIAALRHALSSATLLSASTPRTLFGRGRSFAIPGVAAEAGRGLVERELGRPLESREADVADAIVRELRGHPERLLRCGAIVASGAASLTDLLEALRSGIAEPLEAVWESPLSEDQATMLLLLASLKKGPVSPSLLTWIAGAGATSELLESLRRAGLIRAHSPRYSLAPSIPVGLLGSPDLHPALADSALSDVVGWAGSAKPAELLSSINPLMHVAGILAERVAVDDVHDLTRALFPALLASGRWMAAADLLRRAATVAASAGDELRRAWALHELGTLYAVRGNDDLAHHLLGTAVELRGRMGDQEGLSASLHNLGVVTGEAALAAEEKPQKAESSGAIGAYDEENEARREEEEPPPPLTLGS